MAEGGDVDLRHAYVYTFTLHTWYLYSGRAYHDGMAFRLRDSEGDSDERFGATDDGIIITWHDQQA